MPNGNPELNKQTAAGIAVAAEPQEDFVQATITGEYSSFDSIQKRADVADGSYNVSSGFFKTTCGALVNASGEADLLALKQSRVYGSGQARIDATDRSMVVATDQAKVTASGYAAVLATGYAKVYASESSIVTAMDGSEVYASGRVKIKAFGCATVYASGDSEVEVSEPTMCNIYVYGNAKKVIIPQLP
ncbi:MAG: hypothetical protein KGS72_24425 [Cyanobacteria bacterium REEB67]|nr:hypothetical protein [Cyanobacteria bacterium REEB67]